MFNDKALSFDLAEDDGDLLLRMSSRLIVVVKDTRRKLSARDMTEDFLMKIVRIMTEGSPPEKADRIRRHWRGEESGRSVVLIMIVPPHPTDWGVLKPGAFEYLATAKDVSKKQFRELSKLFDGSPKHPLTI